MNYGSLFTGFGGFDLASEWMGWENIFQCENNPFCKKILKYYWLNTILYDDIKTTDFTIHRGTIDVLSAGPPCQPASIAGKRKGTADDRWLWPETIRAVREIKPKYAVFENPTGIISLEDGRLFKGILSALEDEGYQTECFIIPACGLQSPHKRDRLWIIAYSDSTSAKNKIQTGRNLSASETFTDPNVGNEFDLSRKSEKITTPHTDISDFSEREITSNSSSIRRIQSKQRYETKFNNKNISNWQNWPTQSPVCGGNDGISRKLDGITFSKWRRESIKGYGNAIVPQIAFEIFKAIEIINNYETK
jgi:DNA (cytosine-5)-methyltransferase 1